MLPSRLVLLRILASATLAACVAYEPADLELANLRPEAPPLPAGPLSHAAAIARCLAHDPELRALAELAIAAGADVPATELQGQWDGDDRQLALMVDPIALLRLGPRGGQAAVADARAAEALETLAVARWQRIGRLTEIYAARTALAVLPPLPAAIDPSPFVAAGLASPQAANAVRAAAAAAAAERASRTADLATLHAELRPLLGLTAAADIELAALPAHQPPLLASDDATLRQRPDLALAVAAYQRADAEFRAAVAAQYPAVMFGPDIEVSAGGVDAMAWFTIPIGADGPALAAKHRRTAMRERAIGALLTASNEAAQAERAAAAAAAQLAASEATAAAGIAALAVAERAIATEPDAFAQIATALPMAVRDVAELRQTAVAAARARVRLATARGWPAHHAAETDQ
jgi:hypothetical protein